MSVSKIVDTEVRQYKIDKVKLITKDNKSFTNPINTLYLATNFKGNDYMNDIRLQNTFSRLKSKKTLNTPTSEDNNLKSIPQN